MARVDGDCCGSPKVMKLRFPCRGCVGAWPSCDGGWDRGMIPQQGRVPALYKEGKKFNQNSDTPTRHGFSPLLSH